MRKLLYLSAVAASLLHFPVQAASLHEAAKWGDNAILTALLDAGADIDEIDDDAQATALYYAVLHGHVKAADLLLARGADVNLSSRWGGPPLFRASWKGHAELVSLLLRRGADPNTAFASETALHKASDSGCLACVRLLIDAGADVNVTNKKGHPPIHYAVARGHKAVADFLRVNGYVFPVAPPISLKLKNGNPEKGAAVFERKCRNCHERTRKMLSTIGPPMWNLIGRPIASIPEYEYSKAFDNREGIWSYERFNSFIAAPALVRPGIELMDAEEAVADEADRIDLITYLRLLSDAPMPLP